jgi:hypothetical protein
MLCGVVSTVRASSAAVIPGVEARAASTLNCRGDSPVGASAVVNLRSSWSARRTNRYSTKSCGRSSPGSTTPTPHGRGVSAF